MAISKGLSHRRSHWNTLKTLNLNVFVLGFVDDRRNRETRREEHSWEGREASVDQERQYMHHGQHPHPHKEWETDEYGEWNRQDRHWQHREPQHQVQHKFKPFLSRFICLGDDVKYLLLSSSGVLCNSKLADIQRYLEALRKPARE